MKKALAIFAMICLLASVLFITAFAADPAPNVVIRVSALKNDGKTVVTIKDYTNFEDGWNGAMEFAISSEMKKYDRAVIDLYADWKAVDGEFTDDWFNGDGFKWDTIYFQDDARVTLNMNGHTIDRGLTEWVMNGEVMFIDEDADVIINNGTIKGGCSSTGAGGIHITDDANVTLNNVNLVSNIADDDDGSAVAVYDGATFTMNGGSIANNISRWDNTVAYGTVYVEDATATLNNVTITGNETRAEGSIVYASDSIVTLNNCIVENNEKGEGNSYDGSLFYLCDGAELNINGGIIRDNCVANHAAIIYVCDDGLVTMSNGCKVTGNHAKSVFVQMLASGYTFDISDCEFTDNDGMIAANIQSSRGGISDTTYLFTNCKFNNNNVTNQYQYDFYGHSGAEFVIANCDLGDSTFFGSEHIEFQFADTTKDKAVIGVTLILEDGTTASNKYYDNFEYGWNNAITNALSNGYSRVIVDLYADWTATNGEFTGKTINGPGFDWDTIFLPENVKVTLNMNGHTIDRGLESEEDNGEVICIDKNADVVINDGTIKGGHSDNGAGGIHIHDGASVTLNNVHVKDNTVENDDGSAIAAYNGATLIMNGGSISGNVLHATTATLVDSYGALFLSNSTASLTDVEFSNNTHTGGEHPEGIVIYLKDSHMTMTNCVVKENGNKISGTLKFPHSLIEVDDGSALGVVNCTFENNSTIGLQASSSPLVCSKGTLRVTDSRFLNNGNKELFHNYGILEVTNSHFEGNKASIYMGSGKEGSNFTDCTFDVNEKEGRLETFYFEEGNRLALNNCDLGSSSFNDRSRATIDGTVAVGSMFGEGSLAMIVALLALVSSGAAIFLVVYYNKKKTVSSTTAKTDDEE